MDRAAEAMVEMDSLEAAEMMAVDSLVGATVGMVAPVKRTAAMAAAGWVEKSAERHQGVDTT